MRTDCVLHRELYSVFCGAQYSCLENPMDRGAWRAKVLGVTKESFSTQRLNNKQQRKMGSSECHLNRKRKNTNLRATS